MGLILKQTFYFYVNRRFDSTWMVTLYVASGLNPPRAFSSSPFPAMLQKGSISPFGNSFEKREALFALHPPKEGTFLCKMAQQQPMLSSAYTGRLIYFLFTFHRFCCGMFAGHLLLVDDSPMVEKSLYTFVIPLSSLNSTIVSLQDSQNLLEFP